MRIRYPLVLSLILIAAMATVTAWGWHAVPAGARIATHWDLTGRPNGFMSKPIGLLVLPAIAIAVTALMSVLPLLEPRRQNLIASRKLYVASWLGGLGVIGVAHVMTVMSAAGLRVNVPGFVLVSVALLMIVLGNYLGKSRSMFLVGLRLPWTLTSEYAWGKSNRLAGMTLMATGLFTLLTYALLGVAAGFVVFTAGTVSSAVVGAVAGYVYWRRDPNRQTGDMA